MNNIGQEIYNLIIELFPICRSITGNGVRQTLKIISRHIPLKIHEVASGTKVFDWTVPQEWNIRDAFILDQNNNKIVDFKKNNLHVVGYSIPTDQYLNLAELQEHLYSLPGQPEAIPYITSYYQERWGFCLSHRQRKALKPGRYRAVIDSQLKKGSLTYGELIIPGKTIQEVFLSTYICHPSMANNELSGPALAVFLAKWLSQKARRYTYRLAFVPETIGSITYLNKNLAAMKKNVAAGFNISCVGDKGKFSFLPSRNGQTLADKAALTVLRFARPNFIRYSYLDRGSDERQYNSPGVDLPVACLMRSKYGAYSQYHTSLDNLDFISPQALAGSYRLFQVCLDLIEKNRFYRLVCLAEPQLSRRGLYPSLSTKESKAKVKTMMNFLAYTDGQNDLIDISNIIKEAPWRLYPIIEKLEKKGIIQRLS